MATLYSDLVLLPSEIHCLYLDTTFLSALENAPRENSWVYVMFILFAYFFLGTTALHWLPPNAGKQLLCMFCLDFIFVYSEKLSPIIAILWWMKLEHAHPISLNFLYHF